MSIEHYENFPVASWLCPAPLRPAVTAIYWFARTADDLADEGDAPAAERLARLGAYRQSLDAAVVDADAPGWPEVFMPLRRVLQAFPLDPRHLHDLLSAFEQDVHNPVYLDRAQLLDYCRRSANPVGRLLLSLYGVAGDRSLEQSDAICSALQLINFWQDIGRDLSNRRCYVPVTDAARHGLGLSDIQPKQDTPATRALLRDLCDWSKTLMLQGAPLVHALPGRAGWELRLVVQGGLRILERIRRMDHETLSHRPTLRSIDAPLMLLRSIGMRKPALAGAPA